MFANSSRVLLGPVFAVALVALPLHANASSSGDEARVWVKRAQDAMGMARLGDRVIHAHLALAQIENYQSDRYYPPFFSAMAALESWFGGSNGVERESGQRVFPGAGPLPTVTLRDSRFSYTIRNDKPVLLPHSALQARYLNPWAVVFDWSRSENIRVAGTEVYRDYPRIVLARTTPDGEQRLFLDVKTGFPVKLDFTEPHYLWGQRHIEYVYSTWVQQGQVQVSSAAFRLADGEVEVSETVGTVELIEPAAAASLLQMSPAPDGPLEDGPAFLQPKPPTTVQVGPSTYLLSNPGYTEAVTLARGEIFVFDATQGEERARLDAEQIAKLFPGRHKINVVITDLAWPHIAGVRYWVAQGATIISHKSALPFLRSIVARHWTLKPDQLEQHRGATFNFVGVESSQSLAGGEITLLPIDGIGSEIALAGYVAGDRFLWASDYIQDVTQPTAYATEVWNAVQRAHLQPQRVAAEHIKLTPWETIASLQERQ